MSTHAAVIPLALLVLKIAAQIYLVCSRPGGMRAAGTALTLRLSGGAVPVPGKIPVCREMPSSAPYPYQGCRSCGKVLPWSGKLCSAGKAQGRAGLGPGQEVALWGSCFMGFHRQDGHQTKPGHSLSTDPLCILGQQPHSKPDCSSTAEGSFG